MIENKNNRPHNLAVLAKNYEDRQLDQTSYLSSSLDDSPLFKAKIKKTKKERLKKEGKEEELELPDFNKFYEIDSMEERILKFFEEENILMANPKEKKFEYFEKIKQNTFLTHLLLDRSRSESERELSLERSSLLNKRRNSFYLPSPNIENEESVNSHSFCSQKVIEDKSCEEKAFEKHKDSNKKKSKFLQSSLTSNFMQSLSEGSKNFPNDDEEINDFNNGSDSIIGNSMVFGNNKDNN